MASEGDMVNIQQLKHHIIAHWTAGTEEANQLRHDLHRLVEAVKDEYKLSGNGMKVQEAKQHFLNGWRRKFRADEIPAVRFDLHAIVEATRQEYKLLSPIQINDIIVSLEWILNKQQFDCDCEPLYEHDTNATTHSDNCALSMIDHIEATLDELRKVAA